MKHFTNTSPGGCGKAGPCQAQPPLTITPPGNRLLQQEQLWGQKDLWGDKLSWVEQAGRRLRTSGLIQEQSDGLGSNTWLASEGRIFSARTQQSPMTSHHPLSARVEQAEIKPRV